MENRKRYIDFLKGCAIILVVIGHAIQYSVSEPDRIWIFKAIYSFHMPLFIFISGILVYRSKLVLKCEWIKKKVVSLLIPFATWILIPLIISKQWNDFIPRIKSIFWNIQISNWFLVSLFWCHLIFFCTRNILFYLLKDNHFISELLLDVLIVILFSVLRMTNLPLGIEKISFWYLFYIIGYYFSKYRYKCIEFLRASFGKKMLFLIVIGAIWLVLLDSWNRTSDSNIIVQMELAGFSFSPIERGIINRLCSYSTSLFGIAFFSMIIYFLFTKFFSQLRHEKSIIESLGQATMEIYILQYYFIGILHIDNVLVMVITNVIMGLFIPFMISRAIKVGQARKVLFGR